MLYVEPLSFSNQVYIKIANSTFHNNTDVCLLRFTKENSLTPNLITYVSLTNLTITNNNQHYYAEDLILITIAYVEEFSTINLWIITGIIVLLSYSLLQYNL